MYNEVKKMHKLHERTTAQCRVPKFLGQLPPLHSVSQNMWQLLRIAQIPQLAENYAIIIIFADEF